MDEATLRVLKHGTVEELLALAGSRPPRDRIRLRAQRRVGALLMHEARYYDHREHPPDLKANVEAVGFVPRELEVGDYESANVIVERKSDDFIPSLFEGRLFEQLDRLAASPVKGFLFIDRSWDSIVAELDSRDTDLNPLKWAAGTIASLCVRGFPPVTIEDRGLFALTLAEVARKARDGRTRGAGLAGSSPTLPLTGFPGVGPDRAATLLRKYGTLAAVFDAALHDEKAVRQSKTLAAIRSKLLERYEEEPV